MSRLTSALARILLLLSLTALSALLPALPGVGSALIAPAAAQNVKIATVDFQRAINEVAEGKAAKARLESIYAEKKAALERMQSSLQAKMGEYEKQKVVLSEAARKAKEEEITNEQMAFQQAYMRYESEFQQMYLGAMDTLLQRMRKIAEAIGAERGYTLIVEMTEGGIVYASSSIDITDELIKRYNTQYPGQ